MPLDATVTPSKQFAKTNDPVTVDKLNLLGTPTVSVSGDLAQLDDVSSSAPANGQPFVYNSGTGRWGPGLVAVAYLGGGSPNGSLFLRGDGTWADPGTTSTAERLYLNSHLY
jgi:hypothetical protein